MKHILRIAVLAMFLCLLAACGTLTDDGRLFFKTADPNVSIAFKLLPAPPPPLPTITPDVTPCENVLGNIGQDGVKRYFLPGHRNYNQVVIDESKGEKVFCTEQDAIDAGWVKAGN